MTIADYFGLGLMAFVIVEGAIAFARLVATTKKETPQ